MKNKLTKLLSFGFVLFAISVLLTNCEKEITLEETILIEDEEPTLTLRFYSKENIEKNTKLVSKLKEFNDKLTKNKSAKLSAKSVYNKEYDFTIYPDSAIYIENGDYHSYTFPLIQGAKEKITNVVFELNAQSEYDAFLIKYEYTAKELKEIDSSSLTLKVLKERINLDFNSLFSKTKAAYVCFYNYEMKCCNNWIAGYGCGELTGANYENPRCWWQPTDGFCEMVYYEVQDNTTYNNNTATVTISGTNYSGTSSAPQTSPMPSPFDAEELIKINAVKAELALNHPERLWVDQHGGIVLQLHDFLTQEMWSDEAGVFCKNAIRVWMENPNANPFLGADCRSFEYAKPPGASQRGCGVTDMDITFYTAGIRPNGSSYYGDIDINTSLIYFTAPTWMTNSQAANATALAVTKAIDLTRLYFYENPDITEQNLAIVFNSNLISQMGLIGGTASPIAPFTIPSPAKFISEFFGAATDC